MKKETKRLVEIVWIFVIIYALTLVIFSSFRKEDNFYYYKQGKIDALNKVVSSVTNWYQSCEGDEILLFSNSPDITGIEAIFKCQKYDEKTEKPTHAFMIYSGNNLLK